MLKEDLAEALRSYSGDPSPGGRRLLLITYFCLFKPGLQAVLLHRLAHMLATRYRVPVLPSMVALLAYYLTGCEIEPTARIAGGFVVMHPSGVVIHGGVVAGRNLRVYSGVAIGNRAGGERSGPPAIGDDVTVGTGAKVLGPITVGSGAAIGANAVVLHDIPAGHRAVGIPAVSSPLISVPR